MANGVKLTGVLATVLALTVLAPLELGETSPLSYQALKQLMEAMNQRTYNLPNAYQTRSQQMMPPPMRNNDPLPVAGPVLVTEIEPGKIKNCLESFATHNVMHTYTYTHSDTHTHTPSQTTVYPS